MMKLAKLYLMTMVICVVAGICGRTLRGSDTPTIPDSVKVKILTIQKDQLAMTSEYQQLQSRMSELQQKFTKAQENLVAVQDEAYKAAKVDKKDWTLDLAKLEFVAIPKPAVAEKKP
jgi:hypothetical protein